MPKGGKLDRAHTAITRKLGGGKRASSRAWAIMTAKGMAKHKGRHMIGTKKLSRKKK